MDIKEKLISVCDDILSIIERNSVQYGMDVSHRLESVKNAIQSYVFKVYIVGPFSSGKSSLLNRWLGCDILSTGLTPETAISTELRYGEIERMELFSLTNENLIETLSGLNEDNMERVRNKANAGELSNVILYMNNPKLKMYSDFCLVDLPGLSSANLAHDAALMRFVQEPDPIGVFCLPMKDGTIQGDALRFIKKMSRFGDFNVLLTKSDQCLESAHIEISEIVKKIIHKETGHEVRIGIVSKDTVQDFQEMIERYIKRKNEYLANRFVREISSIIDLIVEPLRVALSKRFTSTEIDDAITKIEETQHSVSKVIDEIQNDLHASIEFASNEVLLKVRTAVHDQGASILAANTSNSIDWSHIASIINTTIAYSAPNAMMDVIERANVKANEEIGEELDFNIIDVDESTDVFPVTDTLSQNVSHSEKKSWFEELTEGNGNISGIGMLIGELLLPSGIGLVVGATVGAFLELKQKDDQKSKQEAQLRMAMDKVANETHPKIRQVLNNAANQYINNLREASKKRLTALKERMEQLRAENESSRAEWETIQQTRHNDLSKVERIKIQLMENF